MPQKIASMTTLQKLNHLKVYSYNYRSDEFPSLDLPTGRQVGVMAQEVKKVFPQLVTTHKSGYMQVNYQGLTAVLIASVNELTKRNLQHEKRIRSLEIMLKKSYSAGE